MDQEHQSCLCRLPPINFPFSIFLFFTSFQLGLSSISSCELSPLSPVRTGAPFSYWWNLKKISLCSLETAAIHPASTLEREEAEKMLIRQTVFLILCHLLKLQDVLTLFRADRDSTIFFLLISSVQYFFTDRLIYTLYSKTHPHIFCLPH